MECGCSDKKRNDEMKVELAARLLGVEPITNETKFSMKMERSNPMINLYELMKLVDNMTKVRIEVRSEEMALTPHKLAVYGEHMVKKVFVNCQGELEVELTDDKPMHCR